MTWKIDYNPIAELPKLTWLAVIEPGSKRVKVFHGRAVECRDEWLVEGIWDGEFARGEFHRSEHFFGSGLRVDGERLYCVPSSALVDRLCYCRQDTTMVVSNSVIALLAFTHSQLDRSHDYNVECASILQGLEKYQKDFTILNPQIERFYQVYHDNIVIDQDGIAFERRSRIHEIASFGEYFALLNDVLTRLQRNSASAERRTRLDTFTTISSGYDSTAVACLAKAIGVKTCFTSRRSNSSMPAWIDRRRAFDDGGPIAAALGMQAIYLNHAISSSSDDELYFYAVDPQKTELVFHSMAAHIEKHCPAAVVFTGYHGDKMWDSKLEAKYLNDQIIRGDISGLRLSEVRLKSGFIHVAVPFIFASSVASISKITESPDMEPWRLRNAYDRPIPRRIGETSGVARQLFGLRKKMVSTTQALPSNAELRERFFDYLERNYRVKPGLVHLSLTLGRATYLCLRAASNVAPVKRSKRAMAWIRARFKLLERKPIFGKHLDLQSLLFLWSTDTLVQSTAGILSRDVDAAGHMGMERAEVSIDARPRERHGVSVAGV
jgi:hypothetical protein